MRIIRIRSFYILAVAFCLLINDVWADAAGTTWQESYYVNRHKNPVRAIEELQNQYKLSTDISKKLYLKKLIYRVMSENNRPYKINSNAPELEKKYIRALMAAKNADYNQSISLLSDLLNDAIIRDDITLQELFNFQLCKVNNVFGQYLNGNHYCNELSSIISNKTHIPTVQPHDAYLVIAINKTHQGLYNEAVDIYNKIVMTLPEYVPPASVYNNIALILIKLKHYDEAEEYLNKAIDLLNEDPSNTMRMYMYHSIGKLYEVQGKHQQAINMYKSALSLGSTDKNYYGMSSLYLGIGDIYIIENDFDNAEKYLNIAKTVAQNGNNEFILASSNLSLGLMFTKKNEDDKAIVHLDKALNLSKDFDIFEVKQDSLKALSDLYIKSNDSLNAYLHYKEYAENLDYDNFIQLPRSYKILDDTLRERELSNENRELKNKIATIEKLARDKERKYQSLSISLILICAILLFVALISRKTPNT